MNRNGKPVKVGIIGLGSWGSCHLEAFSSMPEVEVVAICDIREERLQQAQSRYGVPLVTTDYERMFAEAELDLVSVCSLESEHLLPTLQALGRGINVIVEKPIATNPASAQQMWKAAVDNGKHIFAGHLLRFEPRYAAIQHAIASGRLGEPKSMFFKRSRTRAMFQTYKRTHTVYELTVHDLDLAIWYAGSRVKSVKAFGRNAVDEATPDILWASLEFINGSLAVLHSNWATPDEAGLVMNDAVEVIGTKATACFDNLGTGLQFLESAGRQSPDPFIHQMLNGAASGALRDQLQYICRSLQSGSDPVHTSFLDALHGIQVADAIIRSIEHQCEVRIE